MISRFKLSTVLICMGLFVFFLYLRFPFKNLRGTLFSEIYKATRIFIVSDDLSPTFLGWPGVVAHNVDVTFPVGSGDLGLSSQKLVVRFGLGQFFPPTPSVSLSLSKLRKGGDLYLKLYQGSSSINLKWDAEEVSLEQLKRDTANALAGVLNSRGKVHWDTVDAAKSEGFVELSLRNLNSPAQMVDMAGNYSFLLPSLNIGPVVGKISIKNGTAEIAEFKIGAEKSDIRGTISGDIKLAKDPMDSFLNLTLRLQLAQSILGNRQADAFVSFLSGFQSSTPGDYAMKWSVNLREFETLSINILPKKVN